MERNELRNAEGTRGITINLSMPHPDLFWYCFNGMDTQKKKKKKRTKNGFPTFFQYIVKPKRNSLGILQKQTSFQYTHMLP